MPVLCEIAEPELRSTGYGIFNFAACITGGAAAALAGFLKEAFGLSAAFQVAALLLLLSVVWLLRLKLAPQQPAS